jgi:3-oxoacyl-[acyl-carrier-protein] synthase-1
MTASRSVVITGLGAVCGAGLKIDALWEAIRAGHPAGAPIAQWDSTHWPARLAAEVTGVDNRTLVEDRKLHKIISRTDLFGLYASGVAIQQSGLLAWRDTLSAEATTRFNDRSGVFSGSGGGNYRSNYDFLPCISSAQGSLEQFGREISATVNPMWLLRNLPNNVLCHVGIRYGFKGTNACVTNQGVGGIMAASEAVAAIRAGEADRAAVVGHDAPIEPETILHYQRLGLVAQDTLRPFDQDRNGTILGEGAAALVLESAETAQERQANILGEFLGSGCTNEATGVLGIRPDGDGVRRAVQFALADARLDPAQVGMIVAHGNGNRVSDGSEVLALRQIFGESLPPVTAFKWACGHLIAASGPLDVALALTALRHRIVPGIATLRSLDPALAPFPVSARPQTPRSNVALVICRGFAGMNVAVLVRAAPVPPAG